MVSSGQCCVKYCQVMARTDDLQQNKETICLSFLSPLLQSRLPRLNPPQLSFTRQPSLSELRRSQDRITIKIWMELAENQSVSPCDFWVDEHNKTDQNWSDIEAEYLDLCVGPQRLDNYQGDKPNLSGVLSCCRLPPHILYPLSVVYVLMGLTGTVGNIMVQIVIFR